MKNLIPQRVIAIAGICLPLISRAVIPTPQVSITTTNPAVVALDVTNVVAGHTYHVEQLGQLNTNTWNSVYCFEGASTNTQGTAMATNATGFFRAWAETNHVKVGQSASFDPPTFHSVSGTAHIVNNCTIELRNFYFDGGGIVVQVYVSPNPSFTPYTAISDDLFGTAFTNATLTLPLPDAVELGDVNYISIWCVAAGVSFGDGMFH